MNIDLEAAAAAETFGVLAVGHKHSRDKKPHAGRMTPGQARALCELALSFVLAARKAGAAQKPLKLGPVSVELKDTGSEEVLSIRKAAAA